MTASKHLGAGEALDLLSRLQATVNEAAAREARLEKEFRTQSHAARQKFDADVEKLRAAHAEELSRIEADFRAREERLSALVEQRKARFNKAHKAAYKQAMEQAEALGGRHKYDIQKRTLEASRLREESLAANEAAHAQFQQQLAENRDLFVALEQQTRAASSGYRKFQRRLFTPLGTDEPDRKKNEHQLFDELLALHAQTTQDLDRFRRHVLPKFFRFLPLWLLITLLLVAHGAWIPALRYLGRTPPGYETVAASLVVLLGWVVAVYWYGRRKTDPSALALARTLEKARRLHNACLEKEDARFQQEMERIEHDYRTTTQSLTQQWGKAASQAGPLRDAGVKQVQNKAERISAKHERRSAARLEQLRRDHAAAVERHQRTTDTQIQQHAAARDQRLAQLTATRETRWQALVAEWKDQTGPIYEALEAARAAAKAQFRQWGEEPPDQWTPPAEFVSAVPFGRVEVDLATLCDGLPKDERLALPGPAAFTVPLMLTFPQHGSLLLETTTTGSGAVEGVLNNIILRLLTQSPPGRVSFTILDPVKLGQNFAGVMHLADYAEHLINSRIWTQSSQIEQRLADLNDHMEKVIQMYLRNEYATIAEYNEQAGNIAEKYHFLVVADFPANFTETAVRRLLHIAASGAKCGVYTLIHWDHRQALPPGLVVEELKKSSAGVTETREGFALTHPLGKLTRLALDAAPDAEFTSELLHQIGQRSVDSNRVEVPFAHVAPAEAELWSGDTTEELRVPIGRTGATKLQYLAIGKGTRQHALIAGKTGSGKSTLFHVVITNLSLWFNPDQVEFYLVDFKKGVEFKCYATHRLPHARVIAIESDREFGLSVLQRVDAELRRRGDLFRQLGVQDLPGYKRAGGREPMPRTLLLVDEFQEFFTEDDQISQNAAVLLDRIVRQGRAFGIHVLLGSQTLGGAYTLARATLGQMVIRLALQCNEADAYLIMDDNNPAPRLLSRPGEGIYNDMAGALEGNSPFQTVWLPDDVRETYLEQVRTQAESSPTKYPAAIVFEGNVPADVAENAALDALLRTAEVKPTTAPRIWMGAPVSIKGPTEAVFRRQSGNNLLVVGQREEAALAILAIGLVSLAAQFPRGAARFVLFDSTPPGSPERAFLERIGNAVPHGLAVVRPADLESALSELADELKQRSEGEGAAEGPTTFLFFHEMQSFKKLRREDDFSFDADAAASPAARLNELICDGPSHGFHVIATCDTYNNVGRFLSRKALSEFEMRVLFQMSANDSASLCDTPKAGALGLHRALFYNEQEGYLEMFRPYALPGNAWIEAAAKQFARLLR